MSTAAKKEWQPGMGEISGFGGGYEAVCQAMVLAGINWIDEHPDCILEVEQYKNVFGISTPTTPDMEALEKTMMDAEVWHEGEKVQDRAGDDCTGAMVHAAHNHVLAYKRLGWEEYVKQMSKEDDEEEAGGE